MPRVPPAPLALVGLALAGRLAALTRAEVIPRDGITFLRLAQAWCAGRPLEALSHYQHPLYPALTAALAGATGLEGETAAVLLSLAAGTLGVLPLHALAHRLAGSRAALGAGLLYAALPPLLRLAARPLADGLYLALLLTALWAAVRSLQEARAAPSLTAGLAGGLAYLTRPEGLAAPAVAALVLAGRQRLRAVLLLGVGLLLTAGPYVAFRSLRAGTLQLTAKKDLRRLTGLRGGPAVQPLSDEGLAGRPRRALAELLRHLLRAAGWIGLPLALLALRHGPPRSPSALLLLLLGALHLLVLYRLALTYGYLAGRHLLGPALLLLVPAGRGLAGLPRRPAAALAFLFVLFGFARALQPVDRPHLPLKRLGLWLRTRLGPGRPLAPMGYPRVAYYARAEVVAPLAKHQGLLSPDPARFRRAVAAFRAALPVGRPVYVVVASRHPQPLRRWLEKNSRERHREGDRQRWWSVASFSSSGF